jgi:PAS domain S-box-containing protein
MREQRAMPRTVLLIHDDGAKARRLTEALLSLSDGFFSVEWVRRCSQAEELLRKDQRKRTGAILVDLFLHDSRGLETFDRLYGISRGVPILIISNIEHQDAAELAVERGARDFLLEDMIDHDVLSEALRTMLERCSQAEGLFSARAAVPGRPDSNEDAMVCADLSGCVTFLNAIAEKLTGWRAAEAVGRPFSDILRIIDVVDHHRAIDPMVLAVKTNTPVNLAEGSVLIRRDGVESAIEASIAPIHDRRGRVTGGVMVFGGAMPASARSGEMSRIAESIM